RRRVLPGWIARVGAAGTGVVRVPDQDSGRRRDYSRRRTAHAGDDGRTGSREAAVRVIAEMAEWIDHRLQLASPIREAAEHPVPRNTSSWWYVFGSAALVIFCLQLATGVLLAMVYVPSAGEAWDSLQALNHQVAFGWFVRALHGWGSNFMIAIVLIHM